MKSLNQNNIDSSFDNELTEYLTLWWYTLNSTILLCGRLAKSDVHTPSTLLKFQFHFRIVVPSSVCYKEVWSLLEGGLDLEDA